MKRAKLNNDKITALYCRLSKNDGTNNESMSIGTQKTMLKEYAKRNGFLNCQFYVDDGIAGKIKGILEEMKIPCIIRQFRNGRELLQASESFDIVFLDIIMNDLDGMKTAQILRKKAFDKILIFVSSSREYVFDAYDVEAFQYLLKPVDDGKMRNILQKGVLKTERRSQNLSLSAGKGRKRSYFLMIYIILR